MNRQALLFIQVDAHTLSLWVCIAALLLSHINKPFIYELSHLLLCYVSNNKFCICIYKKKKDKTAPFSVPAGDSVNLTDWAFHNWENQAQIFYNPDQVL